MKEKLEHHINTVLDGCYDINYGGSSIDRCNFSSLQTMRAGINFIPDNKIGTAIKLFVKIVEEQVLKIREDTNRIDRDHVLSQLKCSLPWISALETLISEYVNI